jgi:uncharacterized membrane protein
MPYAAGIGLLAAGASLFTGWKAHWAGYLLGIAMLLRALVVYLPRIVANLHDPGPWTSGAEMLSMCGGAFVLAGWLVENAVGARTHSYTPTSVLFGQYLFALPLLIVGVQHLMYGAFIATLIPAWIPGHLFWAYFVGVAFIATTLAIVSRMLGTLAAMLSGLMFLLWVVILHLPRCFAARNNANEWTSAAVALAMSGAAYAVAGTLSRREST